MGLAGLGRHRPSSRCRSPRGQEKFDAARFSDGLAEGILGRLVRAQLVKGPRAKGKITYGIKIENASPLVLHGLAVVGGQEQAR